MLISTWRLCTDTASSRVAVSTEDIRETHQCNAEHPVIQPVCRGQYAAVNQPLLLPKLLQRKRQSSAGAQAITVKDCVCLMLTSPKVFIYVMRQADS